CPPHRSPVCLPPRCFQNACAGSRAAPPVSPDLTPAPLQPPPPAAGMRLACCTPPLPAPTAPETTIVPGQTTMAAILPAHALPAAATSSLHPCAAAPRCTPTASQSSDSQRWPSALVQC